MRRYGPLHILKDVDELGVTVQVRANDRWFRLCLQGTLLAIEVGAGNAGVPPEAWLRAFQVDCGEAAPIVSELLRRMEIPPAPRS